jgi:hypothetical protein
MYPLSRGALITIILPIFSVGLYAEDPQQGKWWNYFSPSHWINSAEEDIKRLRDENEKKFEAALPEMARAVAVVGPVSGIVSEPLNWAENMERLASIPLILRSGGAEKDPRFVNFHDAAMRVAELAAQMQSKTRVEVAEKLSNAKINAEASLKGALSTTGPSATIGLGGSNEETTGSRHTRTNSSDIPPATASQAADFVNAYSELYKAYESLLATVKPEFLRELNSRKKL